MNFSRRERSACQAAIYRSPGRLAWRPVAAVAASATVFTTTQGLTYPLLALILDRAGTATWLIGASAAMTPLGMMTAAMAGPQNVHRFGSYRLAVASLLGAALSVTALGAVQDPIVWIPLRFLLGFFGSSLFVVTDTWLNQLAPEGARGRILGLNTTVLSVGFALGPGLLALLGSIGWPPFLAGAGCALLALLPLVANRRDLPEPTEGGRVSLWQFLPRAPLLLLCVGAAALAEQAAMSLLPIYALHGGMTTGGASATLMMMIAGSVTLQYPVGWLADRLPRPSLIAACAAATALLAALLLPGPSWPALFWPTIFLWGGTYFAIFTLSLVLLGERHSGASLLAGNAAFTAVWGLAGLLGAPLAGGAMSLLGAAGLPLVLAGIFGGLAVLLGVFRGRVA